MTPFKSLVPIAKWFLRIAVLVIAYQRYLDTTLSFSFSGMYYFIAALFVIFSILLFIGGFMLNASQTVVSGMAICIISLVLVFNGGFTLNKLLAQFVPAALGFYFMARGNRG